MFFTGTSSIETVRGFESSLASHAAVVRRAGPSRPQLRLVLERDQAGPASSQVALHSHIVEAATDTELALVFAAAAVVRVPMNWPVDVIDAVRVGVGLVLG